MNKHLGRRLFLLGGVASLAEFALFRRAIGETLAAGSSIPTIDALSVTVLMDSSHDIFLRAPTPAAVRIKRFAWPATWPKTLQGQWGLSLALESRAGSETHRTLLDFGYQP